MKVVVSMKIPLLKRIQNTTGKVKKTTVMRDFRIRTWISLPKS